MLPVGWVSASPVARTGYGRMTKELGYRLVDEGVDVTFIGTFGDVIIWGGITEQYTPKGNKIEILALTRPQSAPDVIHGYAAKYGFRAVIGFMDSFGLEYLNNVRLPVIGYIPIDGPFTSKMENYVRNFYKIVAYSKFGYRELQKRYPPSKIDFIDHGVDINVFKPLDAREYDETREWLLKEHGIPKDAFLAIDMAANVGPRKTLPLLMTTFSKTPKDMHLFIFTNAYAPGQGYDLITHRINLKMQNRIHFPTADPILHPASDDHLRKLFGASQVFVHNAVAEGCGLPQLEAMSTGIPPIVPDNSAQTEKTKGLGWLVKNVDPEIYFEFPVYIPTLQEYPVPDQRSLLKNLIEAYENPDLRRKFGRKSRRYVVQIHSWDVIVPKWLTFLRKIEDEMHFFGVLTKAFK